VLERDREENHDNCGTLYGKAKSVYSAKKVAPSGSGKMGYWCVGMTEKFQITNNKYQTNHNDQSSKFQTVSVIWYWNLRFVCNLVLGI
jgi:hypothetical protein